MSAIAEQLEYAGQDSVLFAAASANYMAGLAYLRLRDCGWQFCRICKKSGVVRVLKPNGGAWHEVTDSACDCRGFAYRAWCYHRAAVILCGGPESVNELIERFP